MYELGSRLKALRKQRGLTQESLARRINKSKSAIASYECGRQLPPLEVLISIAITLNVSLDFLVGFERNKCDFSHDLNETQEKLLNALIAELRKPTGKGQMLSAVQIGIINELILLFQENNSSTH